MIYREYTLGRYSNLFFIVIKLAIIVTLVIEAEK